MLPVDRYGFPRNSAPEDVPCLNNAPLRRRPIELAPTPSYRDTYRTRIVTDPFAVPIDQKLELLRSAAAQARSVPGVFSVMGMIG